jgi:hypothetical protein
MKGFMENKKMLFVIYLYEELNEATGQFSHSTEFQVIAESEDEALKIAKIYQPEKKNYYVKQIIDMELVKKR